MIRHPNTAILMAALVLPSLAFAGPNTSAQSPNQVAAAKTPAKRGKMVRLYAGRHGAWVLQCFRNPQKRVVCNLGQARVYKVPAADRKKIKGTPQLILLVQGSTAAEAVLFISPSKYAKESRLLARVDKKYGFGIETPSTSAIAAITPKETKVIVTNFMVGNELRVKFLPAVGGVQLLRFSLAGFTSGIKTMRALIKKHGKNEPKLVKKPTPKKPAGGAKK